MDFGLIEEMLEDLIDDKTFESSSVEINYAGIGNLYDVAVYDQDGELMCHTTVEINNEDESDVVETIFSQLDV